MIRCRVQVFCTESNSVKEVHLLATVLAGESVTGGVGSGSLFQGMVVGGCKDGVATLLLDTAHRPF